MKKILVLVLAVLLCFGAQAETDFPGLFIDAVGGLIDQVSAVIEGKAPGVGHVPEKVNPSPDKYTWYIQDYVGRNAAGFGYTSLGGDRLEQYGHGYMEFCFITPDGSYLDFSDEKALSKYVVIGQSPAPNTELKLTFETDSDGNEYDFLVDHQSIEVIDLLVQKIGEDTGDYRELTQILPAPDKYTRYMRDYVGKNVFSFGYTSLGGDRMDAYGQGYMEFVFVADDGAYLDPEDEELLKQYVVTGQDIAPNTEIRMTFMKDSDGNEYSNLVQSQTYEKITLYVTRLGK